MKYVAEGGHVLPVQPRVQLPVHIVGPCGPLGVDIEHYPAVETVAGGDAGDGFQGVVQIVGPGGGGVYAYADKGVLAPGAQDVTILGVEIRHIQPLAAVVILSVAGEAEGLFKAEDVYGLACALRNMHDLSPLTLLYISPVGW